MIALTDCTLETLNHYNAVEVHPVEEVNGNTEQVEKAMIGRNPEAHYFWAVYLHLTRGGLEWVADFTTEEKAEIFAQGIQFMLGAAIADKLIIKR